MNAKKSCPCCSDSMLLHLSNRHSYWYCSSCRIEMPHIDLDLPQIVNQGTSLSLNPSNIKSTAPTRRKVKLNLSFKTRNVV